MLDFYYLGLESKIPRYLTKGQDMRKRHTLGARVRGEVDRGLRRRSDVSVSIVCVGTIKRVACSGR